MALNIHLRFGDKLVEAGEVRSDEPAEVHPYQVLFAEIEEEVGGEFGVDPVGEKIFYKFLYFREVGTTAWFAIGNEEQLENFLFEFLEFGLGIRVKPEFKVFLCFRTLFINLEDDLGKALPVLFFQCFF